MLGKKAMLGNIIGGFMMILVGMTLLTTISQEIDNSINCIQENNTNEYYGSTNSFGGGGAEHFGGYDGEIKTRNFLSDLAPYQTDKSIINPNCEPITGMSKTVLKSTPYFFMFGIILAAICMVINGLKNRGLFNKDDEDDKY